MAAFASVFVNGFDFGTTEEDLVAHMQNVGTVVSTDMKQGSAVVTFSTAAEAQTAVSSLNQSTIPGNSRYIDVQIDKKSMPPAAGMKRSFTAQSNGVNGGAKVLVRGFDFDTTDEQLWAHLGTVGGVAEVHWVSKGSANVIYSSAAGAAAAANQLNGSTIPGNTRFIEVIAGGDGAADAKRFKGAAYDFWGGKGSALSSPNPGGKGKGGGKSGKGGKHGDHSDEDPPGSGRVFVRGFDFGTSDEQLEGHMMQAGPIHTVHWVNQGNCIVVYKRMASATKAVATLDNTTIPGNSRYINVIPRS